jgi:hypothetical protein
VGCLLNALTLGLARRLLARRMRRIGAWDRWPFFRETDYRSAAALRGGRAVAIDPERAAGTGR